MEDKPVTSVPETKPKTTFEMLEKITKAAVAVLAVSYGLGLIVSNQYLAPLGISDFSSLKPKYILTGLWTLLLLTIGSLPVSFRFIAAPKSRAEKYSVSIPVGLLVSSGAITTFLAVVLGFDFSKQTWRIIAAIFFYLIFGGCLTAFYWKRLWVDVRTDRSVIFDWFMVIVSLCFTLVPVTRGVAENIYRQVPEALGGGEPVGACVILYKDKGGAEFWSQAGVVEDEPLKRFEGNMRLVKIVYQDEKNLLVEGVDMNNPNLNSAGKAIVISRDLVEGFVMTDRRNPCGSYPVPKPTPSSSPTPEPSATVANSSTRTNH